jgi:hypothetical protein
MNRRLQKEIDYDVAEKVGHKWALTEFMIEMWSNEKNDVKQHMIIINVSARVTT